MERWREAKQVLHDHQKNHESLREAHLESLARARCEASSSPVTATKLERAIKQLIIREKPRKAFRKIGAVLNPSSQINALSRVDIPASPIEEPYPIGPDPKVWKDSWKSVTEPDQIVRHVCAANQRQYNQAASTPFGSGPLLELIGYKADTPAIASLLSNNAPPPGLMQDQSVISFLSSPLPFPTSTPVCGITSQQFTKLYSILNEATSSSPSGRHLGHYKVVVKNPTLSSIHSNMMSIPYTVGISPPHWHKVIDIMLEKSPRDPKNQRLQIIALLESDLNQMNRMLLARPLTWLLEDNNIISEMQYGSRSGKLCQSAALNKQLVFDNLRLTKETVVFIENDAMGCFDRIVNPLILLFLL
jgi:hypothetical protein